MPLSTRGVPPLASTGATAFVLLGALGAAVLWLTLPFPTVSVNVRWRPGVTETERIALESTLRLTEGRQVEDTTWRYTLVDYSSDHIRVIVTHPQVEDTHRLDRARYLPSEPPIGRNWQIAAGALAFGAMGPVFLLASRLRARLLLAQPPKAAATTAPATWHIVAVAGLTMACWSALFSSTYTLAFYWDDLHFIRPYSLSELASTLHGPNDPDGIETVALRPVATLLFCLQGVLLGEHILLQRLFMATLMGGLLVAVGLLLREAGLSLRHVLVVFALFASSRVFASLVLWITLGTVILAYILTTLSAFCYLRWMDRRQAFFLWLTVALAALSILTREEAYTLPAVLPLVWLMARGPKQWQRALAGAAAVGVVMAIHALLRHTFLPNAPPVRLSWMSLTQGLWPSVHSSWLPGGLRAFGPVDPWLKGLWQGFLGALVILFALVGRNRARLAVIGLCVLALILCAPSLGEPRSFGIALPSLAFFAAISIAVFEVRGLVLPSALGRQVWQPAVSLMLSLGLAIGIGAGVRRSRFVAEALDVHVVERVIRDGSFFFNAKATVPPARRRAGLERLAGVGIRSPEDLMRLKRLGFDDNAPSILERLGSPLFIETYDYLSF